MVVLRDKLNFISVTYLPILNLLVPYVCLYQKKKFLVKANTEDPWLSSQNTYGVAINLCVPSRLEGV